MNKDLIIKQFEALISSETDTIALLANTSAFLNDLLENINWVGFYFNKNNELILGPFQGKVACSHIPFSKGVCGKAATTLEVQRIADVHQFKGHIACDNASNSEIVLPIVINNQLFGLLDIDSPTTNRFSQENQELLEEIVKVLTSYIKV